MAKTKEISRRIKSVSSTKKITKAMEMVSVSKMRKAIEAVLKTRTYANLSWETILHLAKTDKRIKSLHPLLKSREKIERIAVILITSNRGMCGGYNSAVMAKVKDSIKKHDVPTDFIIVGKKGLGLHSQGYEITAEFEKSDLLDGIKDVYPIVKMVLDDYSSGKYDKIFVAYTDFVNPVKQIPRVKQLLPVEVDKSDEYLGIIGRDSKVAVSQELIKEKQQKHLGVDGAVLEFLFEPSPSEVLDLMIPRLLEVQLYQAFLEANASEHSARMTTMHQATEAATEMVSELTLFYNKERQAGITAEIAEISAGANALAE